MSSAHPVTLFVRDVLTNYKQVQDVPVAAGVRLIRGGALVGPAASNENNPPKSWME